MAKKYPEVIEAPDDDDGNDWQDVRPINVKDVAAYKEKVEKVFEMMSLMIVDDCKDAVQATVTSFKKLAVKHWKVMQDADVEVVVRSIHNSAGVYLCQVLTEGGINVVDTAQEVPQPQEFLQSLPEKCRWEEEKQLIISALDHASEVHVHASMMYTHISSLAKVCDKEMADLVLQTMGRLLMQLNVPECFANPTMDERPKTMEQE